MLHATEYQHGKRIGTGTTGELVPKAIANGGFVWISVDHPTPAEIDELVNALALHPLVVADLKRPHQRPKTERYDDLLFVAMRSAEYVADADEVCIGEIQLVWGPHFVAMVRHGAPDPLQDLPNRLPHAHTAPKVSPPGIVHAAVDLVVSPYQDVLDKLDRDIGDAEIDVFSARNHQRTDLLRRISRIQRDGLELKRVMTPLRRALRQLRRDPLVRDADGWDSYFRDSESHLARSLERLDALTPRADAAQSNNAAQISLQQNDDMRKISAWAAIITLPTLLAGIYGMNFENMPELRWAWGYPVALAVMAAIAWLTYRAFRRSGWL